VAILEVDGVRIAFDEYGEKTQGGHVVFIHGFPLNRTMWAPQVDALRGAYHIVVPDMRGHGSSDISEGATTMERMADDVYALISAAGADSVAVVGLSMGGYVALQFARKYPGALRALVLANTRAGADSEEARAGRLEMIKKVASDGPPVVAAEMLPKLLSPRAAVEDAELVAKVRRMIETSAAAGIAASLAGMAQRPDSTGLLGAIAVPTLVIAGTDDQLIPRSDADTLAAAIPGARLALIEGAGHLSNLEKDDEFTTAVREFLAALDAPHVSAPA
jgi:3-oxoadipate enol-lactonase